MDGRTMAIGSSDWGMQGKYGSGNVRLYSYNGTMWNLRGHPLGSGHDSDRDQYGVFMDLSGDGAVVTLGDEWAISSPYKLTNMLCDQLNSYIK
jgi:hypothetical protein